jgi:predicted HTH transcriptional regulator
MSIFDKVDFQIQDLQRLIDDSAEESINLEFKSAEALESKDHNKKEIAKDVSAFANSDGGIIIYGIKEQNHKAHSLTFIDGHRITKEWLEQVINSNIQQRIDGLLIFPIRRNQNIKETIYVVKIPASKSAPHMTTEKKFYRRYNFESVYMEEYEVRRAYNQRSKTDLEIMEPLVEKKEYSSRASQINSISFLLTAQIKNVSNSIEELYKLELKIHEGLYNETNNQSNLQKYKIRNEAEFSVFSIPNSSPIFQNEVASVCTLFITVTKSNQINVANSPIQLTLYFSNGTKHKVYDLRDLLEFDGQPVSEFSFGQ